MAAYPRAIRASVAISAASAAYGVGLWDRPSGSLLVLRGLYRDEVYRGYRVDSRKLEYGPGTIWAGFPSCLGFGVGRESYSNSLAPTVSARFRRVLYGTGIGGPFQGHSQSSFIMAWQGSLPVTSRTGPTAEIPGTKG